MNVYSESLKLARVIGKVWEGYIEDVGSETPGTDFHAVTATENSNEPDGYWQGGALWIDDVRVPLGGGDNNVTYLTSALVTVTTHAGMNFDIEPPVVGYTDGSRAAVGIPFFPRSLLVQSLNAALRDVGRIEVTREVTSTGREVYTTTQGESFGKPVGRIEEAVRVNGADDEWMLHQNWRQGIDALGQGEDAEDKRMRLRFDLGYVPPAGRLLRVTTVEEHAEVSSYGDVISDQVDGNWLTWQAATYALRSKVQEVGNDLPWLRERLNEALQRAAEKGIAHPARRVGVRHASW